MRPSAIATVAALVLVTIVASAADPAHATSPGLSGKIIVADPTAGLWTMDDNGTHRTLITHGQDSNPAASTLFVIFERSGQLFVSDIDGENTGGLNIAATKPTIRPQQPGPLLTGLAAASVAGDLRTIESDGALGANYTNTPGITETDPAFSPDGVWLAYSSNEEPGGDLENPVAGTSFNLWIQPIADNIADKPNPNRRVLWESGTQTYGGNPSWAPDSSRIAFDDNGDIWTIPPDGNNPTDLTNDELDQREPAWSPEGDLVAYAEYSQLIGAGVNGFPYSQVWTIDIDTRERVNLTNDPLAHDRQPEWQPISFAYVWGDNACSGEPDLVDVMDVLLLDAGLPYPPPKNACPDIGDNFIGGEFPWGDTNCDGAADAEDILPVLLYIAEIVLPEQPQGGSSGCRSVGDLIFLPAPVGGGPE